MKTNTILAVLVLVGVAHAGGPATVHFDQLADCGVVGGWELAYEKVVGAGTQPSATAAGVSIPKGSLTCGANVAALVQTTGVGNTRFWLRAVDLTGTVKSVYSNSIDAPLPFASPVLKSVGP